LDVVYSLLRWRRGDVQLHVNRKQNGLLKQ
jgi:hypothetical protein